ncbi:MAG: tetratricopeptide repeat protein [Kiritimatiellae bacterium]|nr:tetratricopeptide repeat protein [Kiritimatiellia bacterium]
MPRRISYLHIFIVALALRIIYLSQAWQHNELIDLQAFERSATLHPADADSPLRMGNTFLSRGKIEEARRHYSESRKRFHPNPKALLGLAQCALEKGDHDQAQAMLKQVFKEWPHSLPALQVAKRIHAEKGEWQAVAGVVSKMAAYPSCRSQAMFELAIVSERLNMHQRAIAIYRDIINGFMFSPFDRTRAAYSAGVLSWRYGKNRQAATAFWGRAARSQTFFGRLAACLLGRTDPATLSESFDDEVKKTGAAYITYTLGLRAWLDDDRPSATQHFESILGQRQARDRQPYELTIPEYWAMADVCRVLAKCIPGSPARGPLSE